MPKGRYAEARREDLDPGDIKISPTGAATIFTQDLTEIPYDNRDISWYNDTANIIAAINAHFVREDQLSVFNRGNQRAIFISTGFLSEISLEVMNGTAGVPNREEILAEMKALLDSSIRKGNLQNDIKLGIFLPAFGSQEITMLLLPYSPTFRHWYERNFLAAPET